MFGLTGVRCQVCSMALENSNYRKDESGRGIYWANPAICNYTDVKVDFCGPVCATAWWKDKIEASKDVTQGT